MQKIPLDFTSFSIIEFPLYVQNFRSIRCVVNAMLSQYYELFYFISSAPRITKPMLLCSFTVRLRIVDRFLCALHIVYVSVAIVEISWLVLPVRKAVAFILFGWLCVYECL